MTTLTDTVRKPSPRIPGGPELVRPENRYANGLARASSTTDKTVCIDLENSPHVPFFKPIIQELEKHGHTILVTARDCFPVCDLADLMGLPYTRIGRHYGKHMLA